MESSEKAPEKKAVKKSVKKSVKKAAKKAVKKSAVKVNATTKGRSADITKFLKTNEDVIGNIDKEIDFIPTGSWVVDRVIGDGLGNNGAGGIPRGFMTEVFGKEGCGKTTLALQAAVECQKAGGLVLFADFEKSLRAQRHYLKNLGLITNDTSKFIHLEPDTLEQGAALIFQATVAFKPDLIVVDSVAAMIPAQFLTGKVEEAIKLGLHAKQVGVFIGTMNKVLQKSNTAILFINQIRAKINSGPGNGPTTDTTGGYAFKFYMHLRIQMAVIQKTSVDGKSDITGDTTKHISDQHVKVTAVKNKMDRPFRSEKIFIKFGKGMDGIKSLIELGKKRGVINGAAWLEYISRTDPGCSFKINGTKKLQEYLEEKPEIVEDMMPLLFPEVDADAYLEAKKNGDIEEDDMTDEMADLMAEMAAGMKSDEAPSTDEDED